MASVLHLYRTASTCLAGTTADSAGVTPAAKEGRRSLQISRKMWRALDKKGEFTPFNYEGFLSRVTPSHEPFWFGIFRSFPSILGYPPLWNPPYSAERCREYMNPLYETPPNKAMVTSREFPHNWDNLGGV